MTRANPKQFSSHCLLLSSCLFVVGILSVELVYSSKKCLHLRQRASLESSDADTATCLQRAHPQIHNSSLSPSLCLSQTFLFPTKRNCYLLLIGLSNAWINNPLASLPTSVNGWRRWEQGMSLSMCVIHDTTPSINGIVLEMIQAIESIDILRISGWLRW